jgi:hypothetical protein
LPEIKYALRVNRKRALNEFLQLGGVNGICRKAETHEGEVRIVRRGFGSWRKRKIIRFRCPFGSLKAILFGVGGIAISALVLAVRQLVEEFE